MYINTLGEPQGADAIDTLSTYETVDQKGIRFEPAGFTQEAATVLLSILRNAQYECAIRLPQGGGNRWYSEPVRLAKFATGGVNCWKESPWPNLYAALLKWERGKGTLTRHTVRFIFFPSGRYAESG